MIHISEKEYVKLLCAQEELRRLECGGVDNWEWYGDSLNPDCEISMDEFEEQLLRKYNEKNTD